MSIVDEPCNTITCMSSINSGKLAHVPNSKSRSGGIEDCGIENPVIKDVKTVCRQVFVAVTSNMDIAVDDTANIEFVMTAPTSKLIKLIAEKNMHKSIISKKNKYNGNY